MGVGLISTLDSFFSTLIQLTQSSLCYFSLYLRDKLRKYFDGGKTKDTDNRKGTAKKNGCKTKQMIILSACLPKLALMLNTLNITIAKM